MQVMKKIDDDSSGTVPRLCSEIQLFDLCDLESCTDKSGRFCTNQDLLSRFERISEDDRQPVMLTRPAGEGGGDDDEPDYDELDDYGADDLEYEGDDEEEE